MDYYLHDGTFLVETGYTNVPPLPKDGVFVEQGKPPGYHPPPSGNMNLRFNIHSRQWEDPRSAGQKMEDARSEKSAKISAACREAILAGFDSAALGALHHYPAGETDQQNLSASVLASLLPGLPEGWITPFWCADASGAWAFRPHTAPEIRQAGQDGKSAILAAMEKNERLQADIAAARTDAEISAILW